MNYRYSGDGLSSRERRLVEAMYDLGYSCRQAGQSFHLTQLPIQPYVHCTAPIPYTFKSVQSAADYLCPIVKNPDFTKLVAE